MIVRPLPPALLATLPTLLLCGCGLTGGDFPSLAPRPAETPRIIASPSESVPPSLSDEERSALKADLAREQQTFAATMQEVAVTRAALGKLLQAPDVSRQGSQAWSAAQMALSRFDLARTPLGSIDVRLVSLLRLTEDLAATDPDRIAVAKLAEEVATAVAAAQRTMDSALKRLG